MNELEEYVKKLDILYEDNHIIVVTKFVNIPSQADKTEDIDMLSIVKEYIRIKYNKPGNVYVGLVHRLDRPVGGVMVFAKTSKAASRLSEEVRTRTIKKKYLCIVNGKMEANNAQLVDYLWKNQNENTSYVVNKNKKNAKEGVLDYKVLKYDKENDLSILEILLHTGRHHQIRVQLSSRMHAIYGDNKYHGRGQGSGICLWAYDLKFVHPVKKEEMEFKKLPTETENKMWKLIKGMEI